VELWKASTDEFVDTLKSERLSRAYVVTDPRSGAVEASHAGLKTLAAAVATDQRDYHKHQGFFVEIGRESDHLLGAFIHLTRRGQAAGGVRFWTYETMEEYIRDGLRLSRGMGHKNALAGIWWGGGKGVVARRGGLDHRDPEVRAKVYRDYGEFVSSLRGCYVTAEDVGTTPEDMAQVFQRTRYTTCIPPAFGGSGNPSILTARGVVVAMEAALQHLGMGTLESKTIALQGLGNVSLYTIDELLRRDVKRIVGTDVDLSAIQAVEERFAGDRLETHLVSPADVSIFARDCDILVPNAVGATLNPQTIPLIRARVVCGAANNQLEDSPRDARTLHDRNILYVPDFLANRMGIVNCANEQYGVFAGDAAIDAHLERDTEFGIFSRCLEVFSRAAESGLTPAEEAEMLADELSAQPHPIWGNRGQQIIDYLVASDWALGESPV